MSRSEPSFGIPGQACFIGPLKEPIPSLSRAKKPLFELGSLETYTNSGSNSGLLSTQFQIEPSTRSRSRHTHYFFDVRSDSELES